MKLIFILLIYCIVKSWNQQKTSNCIAYDLLDQKRSLGISAICTAIYLFFAVVMRAWTSGVLDLDVAIYSVAGAPIFFVACVVSWLIYLDIALYLKRLKKHGYDVPADKRQYHNSLLALPRTLPTYQETLGNSMESILAAAAFLLTSIGVVVSAASLYIKYAAFDIKYFGLFGNTLLLSYGLIRAFMFWRQRLNSKYRDDVEMDKNRKQRKPFSKALMELSVYLCTIVMGTLVLYMGSEVIYHARMNAGLYP